MKNKKSITGQSIDKLIFGYFDSEMSKIEAKYPFEMNITVVPKDHFEKRKARVINIISAACIVLFLGFGMFNYEPPRILEMGIINYYDKHDLDTRIPEAIDAVREIINKYKD